MKNLLIILSLTFVFACHTKEEQNKSAANDPINIIKGDADSSVLSMDAPKPVAPAPAPVDTAAAASDGCIDPAKVQPDAMCTQEFKPVCGCDGKQYPNQCEAEKAGLVKWTDGPCGKEGEKATSKTEKPAEKSATKTTADKKTSKKDAKKKKKK